MSKEHNQNFAQVAFEIENQQLIVESKINLVYK